MKRLLYSLAIALVLGAPLSLSCKAEALNFDFSFSGVGFVTGGSEFTGTVTGEIFGLQNGSTSTPTQISITSAPSEFGLSTPYSFAPFTVAPPAFTVANDQITAIDISPPSLVEAIDSSGYYELVFGYSAGPNQASLIELEESFGTTFTGFADNPLDGVTLATGGSLSAFNFTPAAAPEPSMTLLTFGALASLVFWHLRRPRAR